MWVGESMVFMKTRTVQYSAVTYPGLPEDSTDTGNGASMCLRNSTARTMRKSGDRLVRSLKGVTDSVRDTYNE